MTSKKRRPAGNRPVARNVHTTLVKAAAERDPLVASRLVDLFAGKLDQATLLQVLTMHTHALSVALHSLADHDRLLAELLAPDAATSETE